MRITVSRRRRTVATFALGVGLASAIAVTASAGEVGGEVEIPSGMSAPAPEESYAPYWEEWNGFLEPRPAGFDPSRDLRVVLRGEGDEPMGCEHAFRGGDLYPSTLVAKAGGKLRIANHDGCSHELYAEGLFGPLQTAPGRQRVEDVDGAGDWPVRDQLYPHVVGHLHVLSDLVACAEVDENGKYRFEDVAPGKYTVAVLMGDRETASTTIEVGASGNVTVDPLKLAAKAQ